MSELSVGQYVQAGEGQQGIIAFIGPTSFSAGEWVGVALEAPTGKNNGTVLGVKYFDCKGDKYGLFVRPITVNVIQDAATNGSTQQAGRATPVSASGTLPKRPLSTRPSLSARQSSVGPSPSSSQRRTSTILSPTPKTAVLAAGVSRMSMTSPTKLAPPARPVSTTGSSGPNTRTNTPIARTPSGLGTSRPASAANRQSLMGPPSAPPPSNTRRSSLVSPPITGPTRTSSMSSVSSRTGTARPTLRTAATTVGKRASIASSSSGRSSPEVTTPGLTRRGSRLSVSGDESTRTSLADLKKPATTGGLATMRESVSPAPSLGMTSKSSSALTKEIEDLKSKIRLLEKKRLEDRDKLQAMARVEAERDKYEIIIQKLQTKMQPQQAEISDLRKQIKDLETQREELEMQKQENEMIVEMATLDREMAEENFEVMKTEVTALKARLEEVDLEVEVLREENAELSKGMSPEEKTTAGWLQMERQNERLKEALLRLRDVTMQQEADLKHTVKSLENDNNELTQFKEQYELSREKLMQAEIAIEDLRSQLDNALGAEEMLEELTEKNLSFSEQVDELKATIEDLENLKELADELEVNHVETEKQMQEELDYKDLQLMDQSKRIIQQDEVFVDYNHTITRFRELVLSLQSDLENLRASNQENATTTEELSSRSRTIMDMNLKLQMSATKSQIKTIDLELRKMEAQEATEHLSILQLYLSESFDSEKESILALLRFRRVSFKANLIHSHVKEALNEDFELNQEDRALTAADICDKLAWVTAMCDRFINCISSSSVPQFDQFRGALLELEPVERTLNMWIDAIRKDELKDKQVADELTRTIALMTHLGEVHLANDLEGYAENVHMKVLMTQSYLESSASSIFFSKQIVLNRLPPTSDDADMSTHFARRADGLIANCRSAKVVVSKILRSLDELKSRWLTLRPDTLPSFERCEEMSRKLADYARGSGLELYKLLFETGREAVVMFDEVQGVMYRTTEKLLGLIDSDIFQSAGKELKILTSGLVEIGAVSGDLDMTVEFEKRPHPWIVRARELKSTKSTTVDVEEEIRRLKDDAHSRATQIKIREQALEESAVRIEHLESRVSNLAKQSVQIEKLERNLSESAIREKDIAESLDNLTEELQTLENEVVKWKKIASESRPVNDDDKAGLERAVATAREVDGLKKEIEGLQGAVGFLRDDARRSREADVMDSNSWLFEPLVLENKGVAEDDARDQDLAMEGRDVVGEFVGFVTKAKVFDLKGMEDRRKPGAADNKENVISGRRSHRLTEETPQYHYMKQREEYESVIAWRDSIVHRGTIHGERKEERRPKRPKGKMQHGTVKVKFAVPMAYMLQKEGLEKGFRDGPEAMFDIERAGDFEEMMNGDGVLVV